MPKKQRAEKRAGGAGEGGEKILYIFHYYITFFSRNLKFSLTIATIFF